MKKSRIFLLFFVCFQTVTSLYSQTFEPLKQTYQRYNIVEIPSASDYPDIPAVGILTVYEYKQLGPAHHQRSLHKIVKILTVKGKEYATVRIPCVSACQIAGRTHKSDGRIVSLPARDLIRNEKLTDYTVPFHYVQFAFPQVEPGDIIEYKAVLDFPYSFFLDDFRFAEPYPLRKGVLVLSHPDDYSYSYVRYAPSGGASISVQKDQFFESTDRFLRTTFIVENVAPLVVEPFSSDTRESRTGVRMVLDGRYGTPFPAFRDWFSYGEFLSPHVRVRALIPGPLKLFIRDTIGTHTDPATIVRLIYQAAEKRTVILNHSLLSTGFEFESAEQVWERKRATPHGFALFLATLYKDLKFSSELILVNSHLQPQANREAAYPPDLDLVFLNVKTPTGEIILDCNGNGRLPNILPSEAMNRLALGIPVLFEYQNMRVNPFLTTTPYHSGNRSELQITATPDEQRWVLSFQWILSGEHMSDFIVDLRRNGEATLQKEIREFVQLYLRGLDWKNIGYRFVSGGMELRGQTSIPRYRVTSGLELFQNDFVLTGLEIRPHLLENRSTPILLPFAGEMSISIVLQLPSGTRALLPPSYRSECNPISYTLTFQNGNREIRIQEKITMRDMMVPKTVFPKFGAFLDQYYANHFWNILIEGGA